jgi:hypothetical protein
MKRPADAHLILEIRQDSVKYWCGQIQRTTSRLPGPPDTGDRGRRQLKAWREGGRSVCNKCAKAIGK